MANSNQTRIATTDRLASVEYDIVAVQMQMADALAYGAGHDVEARHTLRLLVIQRDGLRAQLRGMGR